MRYVLIIATIFYLGCEHEHAEYTLLEHEHDLIEHSHPLNEHSHELVEHKHNYALPTHNHALADHKHSEKDLVLRDVESRIRILERFREHTHVDLYSQIVTHDHNSTRLTFDECPIPDFDLDWKGKSVFKFRGISEYDRKPSGRLLLSNGRYGAMALTSSTYILNDGWGRGHDYVIGGWVTNSKRIVVNFIGTDSTDGHTEQMSDGRLTANEVIRGNFVNSWIGIDDDNTTLEYQLDIDEQGVFRKSSSSSGSSCFNGNGRDEQLALDLIERLLPLANDLLTLMEGY